MHIAYLLNLPEAGKLIIEYPLPDGTDIKDVDPEGKHTINIAHIDDFSDYIFVFQSDGSPHLVTGDYDGRMFGIDLYTSYPGLTETRQYPKEVEPDDRLKAYVNYLVSMGRAVICMNKTKDLAKYILNNPENGCNAP